MTSPGHLSTFGNREIHARKGQHAIALCGDKGPSLWTTSRVAVTCEACKREIERRLEARRGK